MASSTKTNLALVIWLIGGAGLSYAFGDAIFAFGGEGATVIVGLLYFALLPLAYFWLSP